MREWIRAYKAEAESVAQSQRLNSEERLHQRTIIEIKAPAFWRATLTEVQQQALEIREVFSPNTQYRTSFKLTAKGFELRSETFPSLTIQAELNEKTSRLIVVKTIRSSIYSAGTEQKSEGLVYLDDREEIHIEYDGLDYIRPEELAETFVKFVCGIK